MQLEGGGGASNHDDITSLVQQNSIANNPTTVDVLGFLWTTDTDMLSLNPKEPTSTQHTLTTKRDVLKNVSRLFDFIESITPITMLFLQDKLCWDESR